MANEQKRLSASGYAALRANEGVVMRYYNDAPVNGNCTWGIGTLAHFGPCTQEELARTVLPDQVNQVLRDRVREAENIVRASVRQTELTQDQFDAAVSFAYNSRTRNIRAALEPANRGDMPEVARRFMSNVYITPRDRQGRAVGPAQRSNGLANRRRRESQPFQGGSRDRN